MNNSIKNITILTLKSISVIVVVVVTGLLVLYGGFFMFIILNFAAGIA